jgi:hypothetical protein
MAEQDPLQDLKDQFGEMHKSLDKIVENTEPVARVAKAEISHAHKTTPPRAQAAQIELGKETKKQILDALKNIKAQIAPTTHRETTAGGVAADILAGGGSLAGAAKGALSFKAEKAKTAFKKKFDPLNIIHRMTGGSKLATALAGRAMGRSEKSIRTAAGLPGMDTQAPTPATLDQTDSPTQVTGGESTNLLQQMSVTLVKILDKLTNMSGDVEKIREFEKESTELAERQAISMERMHDEAALERAKIKKKEPTPVTKAGEEKKEPGKSWLETIMGWLKKLGLAALAFAGILSKVLNPFSIFTGLLGRMAGTMGLTAGIKALAGGVVGAAKAGGSAILKGGKSIIGGIKGIAEKVVGGVGKAAAATGGTVAAKELGAASKIAKGAGTVAEGAAKIADKGKIAGVLGKLAPKLLKSKAATMIPIVGSAVGLAFAASRLLQGDLIGAGIDAAGALPIPGAAIPSLVASLVRDAYMEIYNADPFTDPLNKERLPSLMTMAKESVSDWLTGESKAKSDSPTQVSNESDAAKLDAIVGAQTGTATAAPAMTPTAYGQVPTAAPNVPQQLAALTNAVPPTELPAPAPMTGQNLSQANDMQRNATGPGGASISAPTVVNNTVHNNRNSSSIHQNMPSPRSGESSYLRSRDREYSPA